MALLEPFDAEAATHRVVTRQRADDTDTDETGRITVENRVVDVAMASGTAVHLQIADGATALEPVTERLERVADPDRVLSGSAPEYRATLPADAAAVRSILAVEPGDTDAWLERVFEIDEFVVLTEDAWCYRSVPHHAHIRELNEADCDGVVAAVADELESIPRTTVVPVDGLVSWRSNDHRYDLSWNVLRRTDGGDDWSAYELPRLRRVRPIPDRAELALEWAPHSADSWPRRATRRVLAPQSVEPPTRLAFPDRDALAETLEALERLRDDLEYAMSIDGFGEGK